MSTLQFLVCVTSVALVASKFLDCWSTASQMDGIDDETNPLARAAMQRFGPSAAIWGVFAVVLLIVAIVGGSAYWGAEELAVASEPTIRTLDLVAVWGYLVLGMGISVVQVAVAHTNWKKRFNPISRTVLRVSRWIGALLRR